MRTTTTQRVLDDYVQSRVRIGPRSRPVPWVLEATANLACLLAGVSP